jgi:pilus assembly protein Flp/PilA
MSFIKKFVRNEKGATAIEYGLIAAGIAVAISVVVFTVGSDLVTLFSNIGTKISTAPT